MDPATAYRLHLGIDRDDVDDDHRPVVVNDLDIFLSRRSRGRSNLRMQRDGRRRLRGTDGTRAYDADDAACSNDEASSILWLGILKMVTK